MDLVNANTVIVNGAPVAITGKSKYKRGMPKVTVKTATIGSEIVVYEDEDFTEATGSATFSMQPTVENIEAYESWQENKGKNAIRLVDSKTGFTKTFNNMSIMEDAEIDFASEIEVVFVGGQGV